MQIQQHSMRWRKKGRVQAPKTFDKLPEECLELDIETYNSMVCPLCEACKLGEARVITNDAGKDGIRQTTRNLYHALALKQMMI